MKNMALKTSTIFLSLSRLHRRAINYKVIYDQPYGRVKLWSELSTSLKATLRVSDLSFGSLSELLTSLKATLRVSDLSFGSPSEHFALQNVTCLASHRIYLSDSLSEQINCVNLWLVNKPSDLSFRFIKIKKNRPQKLI